MKKYLMLLLVATLFVACNNDDNDVKPNEEKPVAAVNDLSSTIGKSYADIIKTYGEPEMQFGGYYMYTNIDTKTTEGITFMVNTTNDQVYSVMQNFKKDAYTAEALKAYFDKNYTYYGTESEVEKMQSRAGDEEDGEGAEVEGLIYGNAKNFNEATVLISIYGNTSVIYLDPNNVPDEEEGPDLSSLTPNAVVTDYMGETYNGLYEAFGSALYDISENEYLVSIEDNQWLMAIGFTLTNDVVSEILLLFNEELTDDDIIAYYKDLGYSATPCGTDDETGKEVYLFMNIETGHMFTYSDLRAVFKDLSDVDDEGDDEGNEED